jgi:predicted GNAT family acetyltransferase
MACTTDPLGPIDQHVRLVRPEELEAYFPSAVAMFTEEVGVDPRLGDSGRGYRARIADLIRSRRAYARFDGETVMFKAEVGSLSNSVALILAAPAMAAVVQSIQRDLRRVPSLYVNQYNRPARRTYDRIGFTQVGTFASVLF